MGSNPAGTFISLEGIDGAGKSTQARLLAAHFRELGKTVHLTREPGGSDGAEEIRRLLVEGDPGRWSPETEILLFMAARRDHLEKVILPRLEADEIVITDRFTDSTRVYQGTVRSDLRPLVDQLHDIVIEREPDLTIIIDMDPDLALQRGLARQSGEDRFEEFGLAFQKSLRAGFLALADEYPDRCKVVNGCQEMAAVAAEVLAVAKGAIHG